VESGIRFFGDEVRDRGVLELAEGLAVEATFHVGGAGFLQGLRAKEASDDVSTVRRGVGHSESVLRAWPIAPLHLH
jgi:hypothetical protein